MRRVVLGTAGHIDHGKTLLTRALTGVDTDRLAEEKARGITIELGFAPMRLSDGTEISLVDVPGHEKFVRTMMTGVSGVDGILLVIAADDGVMPQTREHFDILRLLNLQRGIVVLNKIDLVNEARIQSVQQQICELVRGSFLEYAPICPVSAVTGAGIAQLKEAIDTMVHTCAERNCDRPFRLSVDRAFPVEGFGTVVTGTLTEGTVHTTAQAEILPSGVRVGIRSLQSHGSSAQQALAGTRVAMSFSALPKDSIQRGCTIAEPDSVIMTDLLTARIQILADCPYPIRNSSQLHLFHGTQEQVCKLRLLDSDCLKAGQTGYAQLKLAQPIPVRLDDRFLLRFFSPVLTIGGGTILACSDARLRRNHPPTLQRLEKLADGNLSVRLLQRICDRALQLTDRQLLQKSSNLSYTEYNTAESRLLDDGQVRMLLPGQLISANAAEEKLLQVHTLLSAFHDAYPLQPGMHTAQMRSSAFSASPDIADALLAHWSKLGAIRLEKDCIRLPDFSPVFTQEHKIMQRKLLHFYREAWLFAPDLAAVKEKFGRFGTLFEQTLTNMQISGMLIALTPRYWVHFEAHQEALRIFSGLAAGGAAVTLAQFRTAAGISRKYSQLFLEYWDRRGITRRVGDAHILNRQS